MTDVTHSFSLSKRWIAAVLLLFAVLSVAMPKVRRVGEIKVYSLASERMAHGEQYYRPLEHPPFTYPPFFALPLTVLVGLPFAVQRCIWWFINLTLLAAIVVAITKMVWPVVCRGVDRGGPPVWLNTLLIVLLSGRFLISPLEYESHDLIVLALVVLVGFRMAANRAKSAGFWAGLATACKATPLLILPLLVWHRRFLAAIVMVVAMTAATFLPDLLFPNQEGELWVSCWYKRFVSKVEVGQVADVQGAWASWNSLNQSLPGTLYRVSTPVTPGKHRFDVSLWNLDAATLKYVTLALELTIIGCLAWITWPGRMLRVAPSEYSFFWLGQIGALLCGMLLLSPISSSQHFCALIVPVAFCVTHWMYRRRNVPVAAVFVGILLLGTIGAQDIVGEELEDVMSAYGATTICTLLCLFGTGYILVRESQLRQAVIGKRCGEQEHFQLAPPAAAINQQNTSSRDAMASDILPFAKLVPSEDTDLLRGKLDVSVIVPTYCEAENLPILIPLVAEALSQARLAGEIIVVDDNSPDDTQHLCAKLARSYPLRLLVRSSERGLSSAVIHGMRAADGAVLLVMDADLSHPPERIPALVNSIRSGTADFVIGSRYVPGGGTDEDWGLFRWLNSKIATWLAWPLTAAHDPMAGFFAMRRETFESAGELNPVGYKIGLELMVKCRPRVAEVPISFRDRMHGQSKLSLTEQLNYLRHLGRLYEYRIKGLLATPAATPPKRKAA